jgi:hypothetical protein
MHFGKAGIAIATVLISQEPSVSVYIKSYNFRALQSTNDHE